MSIVGQMVAVVLVPKDEKKPVVGPFYIANGKSFEMIEETARELGYAEGEYGLHTFVSVEEALGVADEGGFNMAP